MSTLGTSLRLRASTVAHDLWGRVGAFRLRGDAVHCPVCGTSARTFVPGGPGRRPGAACVRCGSLERHRLFWLYLTRETDVLTRPQRMLHMAPEPQLQRLLRAVPSLDHVSGDLMDPRADLRVDVTALPFPDAHFDVVVCSHVLEHVPDDLTAVRELMRVLRPGGWAILEAPVDWDLERTEHDPSVTDPAERLRLYGQDDHVRQYGRDYPDVLRAGGAALDLTAFTLSAEERRRFGVPPGTSLHLCHHVQQPADSEA